MTKKLNTKAIALAGLLSLGLFAKPSLAQVPSDESLMRYERAMDYESTYRQNFISGYLSIVKAPLFAALHETHPEATAEQLTKIDQMADEAFTAYVTRIYETHDLAQLGRSVFYKQMKDHYTQEEVDAMIAFYETPVGQRVVKKQPVFGAAFDRQIVQELGSKMFEIAQQNVKEHQKLSQDLRKRVYEFLQ